VVVPLAPFKLGSGPARAVTPPPFLGQHTNEILLNMGFNEESIAVLRTNRVI
jgi:crotonobetainyl-CoA:carnitine CoA-transferase CaiB-like acyl-CoA transferase